MNDAPTTMPEFNKMITRLAAGQKDLAAGLASDSGGGDSGGGSDGGGGGGGGGGD